MRIAAAAACLAFASGAAAAAAEAGDPAPLALYEAGKYEDAIRAGAAQKDAEGYTVAARAELAEEMTRSAPCLACLQQAEAYARKAAATNPKEAECRVYLAASLGYQSHIIGTAAARSKGFAEEAKSNLEAALASQPNDAWALTAMGGWHFAVVEGAGSLLAGWLYGASVKKGLADFAKAFAADPGNIVIRYQYALSLSSYDREAYAKDIQEALQVAATGNAKTAYEVFMQGRARTLFDTLKRDDWKSYDALVRRYQDYPA